MKAFVVGVAVLGAFCGRLDAAPDSPPETALSDYVKAPDPSFAWKKVTAYTVPGAQVVELQLHSQTWQNILWKHLLYVIKPDGLGPDVGQGMLIIAGGRWRDSYETAPPPEHLPDESAIFIELAKRLGSVVAVIGQVPFQPMFGLREDELIAYSFDEYLKTGDADWPLLLPMVKAAVKGMDAVQAFAAEEWHMSLPQFTVLGGSKRGWTTWLTGAVDPRATKLVPIVIDVLNFKAQMPHQSAFWGVPSAALDPYTKRNLVNVLGSDRGAGLRRIVDPYSYRGQLTQPKLIVNATNDVFFPIDDLNLYWNGLQGPKYVLYVPNNGHNINDYGRLIPTIVAFAGHAGPMPDLAWQFDRAGTTARLCVRADPAPSGVVLWSAVSDDTDFRDEVFSSEPVAETKDVYVAQVHAPEAGYEAAFAEVAFGEGEARYTLSTNVRVMNSTGAVPAVSAAVDGNPGICPPR
jgi:PhoPQ-activated pathogenicity-related protein